MRAGLVVVVVAGCYAPEIARGVPCGPEGAGARCPSGQVCVDELCVPPGMNPASDAAGDAIDDVDGDGVPNATDNCVDVANADQANEDTDRFGNRCDPCPPVANDTPADPDSDGVADSCDPHPMVGGDSIVLFEGFHAGVPADWMVVGTWTVAAGGVSAAPVLDELVALRPPVAPDSSSTSSVAMAPTATGTGPGAIGIVAPVSTSHAGLSCLFFYPLANPNERRAGMVHTGSLAIVSSMPYAWTPGDAYVLVEQHTKISYTCDITDKLGVTRSFVGMENAQPSPSLLSVFSRSQSLRVDWVMHVDSPNP